MKIALFSGNGTSDLTRTHVLVMLEQHFENTQITMMRGSDLWTLSPEKYDLFVVPGGPSTPMADEMTYDGLVHIKNYVKAGGKYLGFCGGAYIASKTVTFNTPTQRLSKTRPLSLFQGTKIGPINGKFSVTDNSGFEVRTLKFAKWSQEIPAILNGAGYFEQATNVDNVEVIATYPTGDAAIILCNVGEGLALLSSPHLEYDPFILDADDFISKETLSELEQSNRQRLLLWGKLLSLLNLSEERRELHAIK